MLIGRVAEMPPSSAVWGISVESGPEPQCHRAPETGIPLVEMIRYRSLVFGDHDFAGGGMFGLFKKKVSDKESVRAAIRQEFDATVAAARVAPLSKQARVGKGINDALSAFDREHTKKSFQELAFPDRKVFLDVLAKRQDELRLKNGDVSIEHIGYSLVSKWVIAVAMCDDELMKHFEGHMQYLKRAAQTL